MKDLLEKMKAVLLKGDRVNFRDRRAHYASGNMGCLRDQYWSWKKEPETNPTDFTGAMKMMVGSAVEDGIVKAILNKLSVLGYHLRATQVPVGGTNPTWDGYLDALLVKQVDGAKWEQIVVEIKTKSGYGADLFKKNPEPSPEYMTQLGFYLKDLYEKGITNKGIFLFCLLSDNTFGELVIINVEYNPKTVSAHATSWINSSGQEGSLNTSVDLNHAMERWKLLDFHLDQDEVPAGEYTYKYTLNAETVREIPDAKLKKIIEGSAIHGDWQPLYSRYKNKQLAADGIAPQRTEEEIRIAVAEYRRRHPRSKI